jgi:hypothetical protein
VFIHIPKTGGTSISEALWPLLGPRDYFEMVTGPKHFAAQRVRREFFSSDLQWAGYLSFAFMRNPWDRIYSDYCFSQRMAKVMRADCQPELQQWVRKIRRIGEYPFERFVREEYLKEGAGAYQQYCQDQQRRDLLTFVGKFECLQEDWERVCRSLALRPRPLTHENRSQVPHDRFSAGYRPAYTAELRDLVGERFRDDIERFGYAF